MTEREYNEAEGIRRSALWKLRESPEKYKWCLEHPEPATPALAFGTAAHKLLLEPDAFEQEFAIAPNLDKRTKAGKEAWEQFCAETAGKSILSQDDYDAIREMADKVRSIPLARKLLNGKTEQPFFFTDMDTGELCKVRLDILAEVDGKQTVVDYKTANNAKTEIFNSDIYKHGYHLQAYMYTEAVRQNFLLDEAPDFIFIVQEKKPPYAVNVIRVTEDVLRAGEECFRELMDTLHECKETGYWYGYNGVYGEPNEAFLPGWYSLGDDDEETFTPEPRKRKARTETEPRRKREKLLEEEVAEIRRRYVPRDKANGQTALALEYGVTNQTIYRIVHNQTWKQ